jgi:hypothetical protein
MIAAGAIFAIDGILERTWWQVAVGGCFLAASLVVIVLGRA